jgi:predicted nuclease of predicted toxin-antitoxin system
MRFLADHNLELPVIRALRGAGHDVASMSEDAPGWTDRRVLARAEKEDRILVTNDKDFAELAFLQRSASVGILLLRMPAARSRDKAERLLELVQDQQEHLRGALTVVGPEAARRRAFP